MTTNSRSVIGKRYNMFTIVEKTTETDKHGAYIYVAECDCGNQIKKTLSGLRRRRSCGCSKKVYFKDITGSKRNKLTALYNTNEKSSNGDYIWKFACDCGNEVETTVGRFNSGHTKSCGCQKIESSDNREGSHGMVGTPEHNSWRKMKERCNDPNNKDYADYGGIGITVCESWNRFINFYSDMGDMPSDGQTYSIDRIDTTKGYYPENCRWATSFEQARNKRKLSSNNTTGVKGVKYEDRGNHKRYIASWCDSEGHNRTSSFSITKYGEEEAFRLAVNARVNAIESLKNDNIIYGEQHNISSYEFLSE